IQRIYDGPASGRGLETLLNRCFLASPSSQAVQNRRALLENLLWEHAVASDGQPIRILSLGSGPGQELVDFVKRYRQAADYSALSIICVDVDLDALAYLREQLSFEPTLSLTTIHQDIRRLTTSDLPQVDFAYAAGVFDYFSDPRAAAVLNVVWDALSEGGTFVLGNFADRRPIGDQFAMDHIMRWHLRYRDEQGLQRLVSRSRFGTAQRMLAEPNNINVFALLQK
ncbi:MAG: class I SAM-dependent methyltransferase, partial [Candidatus Binatia bacterium]